MVYNYGLCHVVIVVYKCGVSVEPTWCIAVKCL